MTKEEQLKEALDRFKRESEGGRGALLCIYPEDGATRSYKTMANPNDLVETIVAAMEADESLSWVLRMAIDRYEVRKRSNL